jgi:hypothetical protein
LAKIAVALNDQRSKGAHAWLQPLTDLHQETPLATGFTMLTFGGVIYETVCTVA